MELLIDPTSRYAQKTGVLRRRTVSLVIFALIWNPLSKAGAGLRAQNLTS